MDHNEVIENLVEFVSTNYLDALNILLVSRDWMPRFVDQNNNERLVIIEKINMTGENSITAIQLARNRWLKQIKDAKEIISDLRSDKLAETAKEILEKITEPKNISAAFMTVDNIEGLTAYILYGCLQKYQSQHKFFDNKKILDQLSHSALDLIEPWIQVGVCGFCHHFELLAATYPKKDSNCAYCDRELSICRIYGLNKDFELHKKNNKDLPLFIQAYVLDNIPEEIDVKLSHKMIDQDTKKINGDIDVYVPTTKTGIECKLFVNTTPQGNQFESFKAEILNSFIKYSNFGITRLIAITNLSKAEAQLIKDGIKRDLTEKKIQFDYLQIGYFSIEDLISILDNEIKIIKNTV